MAASSPVQQSFLPTSSCSPTTFLAPQGYPDLQSNPDARVGSDGTYARSPTDAPLNTDIPGGSRDQRPHTPAAPLIDERVQAKERVQAEAKAARERRWWDAGKRVQAKAKAARERRWSDPGELAREKAAFLQKASPRNTIRHLTWNLWYGGPEITAHYGISEIDFSKEEKELEPAHPYVRERIKARQQQAREEPDATGYFDIDVRLQIAVKTIKETAPTVVCLQEVVPSMLNVLKAELAPFYVFIVGTEQDYRVLDALYEERCDGEECIWEDLPPDFNVLLVQADRLEAAAAPSKMIPGPELEQQVDKVQVEVESEDEPGRPRRKTPPIFSALGLSSTSDNLKKTSATHIRTSAKTSAALLSPPQVSMPYMKLRDLAEKIQARALVVPLLDNPQTPECWSLALLAVIVKIDDMNVALFTTHLTAGGKACKGASGRRKQELEWALQRARAAVACSATNGRDGGDGEGEHCHSTVGKNKEDQIEVDFALLAGDLNIRDDEADEVLRRVHAEDALELDEADEVLRGVHAKDAWELAGRPQDHRYTWDMNCNPVFNFPPSAHPQHRFDRTYCLQGVKEDRSTRKKATLIGFELVGTEKLPRNPFTERWRGKTHCASDHFGVLTEWKWSDASEKGSGGEMVHVPKRQEPQRQKLQLKPRTLPLPVENPQGRGNLRPSWLSK